MIRKTTTKKQDQRRPLNIQIKPFKSSNPDKPVLCGFDECNLGARFEITWNHLHRGRIKKARRTRCKGHAGFFAQKHGVEFAA